MDNKILRAVFVIYLLFFLYNLNAQTSKNRQFEKIVSRIEKQEFLFNNYELNAKSVRLANKLNKIATESELVSLSKMECKLCFCYSFWILSKRQSSISDELYKKYFDINDDDKSLQINDFKNNTSCVLIILSDQNFIYEIHNEQKHLDRIKTEYNNVYTK